MARASLLGSWYVWNCPVTLAEPSTFPAALQIHCQQHSTPVGTLMPMPSSSQAASVHGPNLKKYAKQSGIITVIGCIDTRLSV